MKTARIISLFAVLIIVMIALTYNSCKKDKEEEPPPPPPTNEYTLFENVVVLDSLTTPVPIIEGNKYTYNYTSTPPDFQVGDVIIGYTDGGYIKKITAVEKSIKSNSIIVIYVVQAYITEVFKNCNFDLLIPIISNNKSLDNTVLYNKQAGDVELNVMIQEGYINTELTANFKLIRVDGKTILFGLKSSGGVGLKTDVNFEVDGELDPPFGDEKLILPPLLFPFTIGPVPSVIILGFNGGFNVEASAAGFINYSCKANGEIEAGAEYTNTDGWKNFWTPSGDFTNEGVNWGLDVNAMAEVYIKPEIKLLVAGLVGPSINIQPYLNIETSINYPNWMWQINGGYTANLGFHLDALGFYEIADYDIPLTQWNTEIASDNGVISGGQIPTVATNSVTNITETTATCGGDVTDQGSSAVTARGVCWSTSSNPTTSNSITTDGIGTGSFTSNITGLTANTPYYVRAYATNSTGTAYGNQESFTTSNIEPPGEPCPGIPTITDPRDQQVYPTVQIGNQCWLQKNMNYETEDSWCFNNSSTNCETFGRLYKWTVAQTVCPNGWHLPSDDEWCTLTQFIDPTCDCNASIGYTGTDVGVKMKSTSGWYDQGNGNNASGFTVLPGGARSAQGNYGDFGKFAEFWTSTLYTITTKAWYRSFRHDKVGIHRGEVERGWANSVRCIKD